MKWLKKFLVFLKRIGKMESIEVADENYPVDSVSWVSVDEYFKIEFSEPDENGFRSEKRIPMIFISGSFGHREIIGVEPFTSQARDLKSAVARYRPKAKYGG